MFFHSKKQIRINDKFQPRASDLWTVEIYAIVCKKYLLIARLFAEGFFAIFRENPIIISRKFIRFYFYCMKEEQHFFLYISCTNSDLKNISSKIFIVENNLRQVSVS